MVIEPKSGVNIPDNKSKRVLLPEPLTPTTPIDLPFSNL